MADIKPEWVADMAGLRNTRGERGFNRERLNQLVAAAEGSQIFRPFFSDEPLESFMVNALAKPLPPILEITDFGGRKSIDLVLEALDGAIQNALDQE